jgi:hypothetical protein
MADKSFTQEEIDNRIAALEFKSQHTAACRKKNGYKRWDTPDGRKNCVGCKLSACGVSNGPATPHRRLNCAYLIDGKGNTLLTTKMSDDGTGNYTPCGTGCDPHNPLHFGDVWIASLICKDSFFDETLTIQRHRVLAERLSAKTDSEPQIVCVPAHTVWPDDQLSITGMAGRWRQQYFVFANSAKDGCKSVIAHNGKILTTDQGGDDNEVILLPIDA